MSSINKIIQELQVNNISFSENEPLKNHTSFKIGGPARLFCKPKTVGEISTCIQIAKKYTIPTYILGKGSNILFTDAGYAGLIIHIGSSFSSVTAQENSIIANSGAGLAEVCLTAKENSLAGLEFAYGIPGNIGGAIYMNAGAYGGEMKDVVQQVTYLSPNGDIHCIDNKQAEFSYRHSIFQENPWCILSVLFAMQKGEKSKIAAQMADYMGRRTEKQPLELPSAGSAFKRPEGAYASALIDQSGLRGFRVGDAAISEKHCGFIVNLGNATCADVLALAEQVSAIVKQKTGFVLEKEIRVVSEKQNFFTL